MWLVPYQGDESENEGKEAKQEENRGRGGSETAPELKKIKVRIHGRNMKGRMSAALFYSIST